MANCVLGLILFISCCSGCLAGTSGEYRLKVDLFEKYNPSVRPVKKTDSAVVVHFDLALRSISELNEKEQNLQITTWIRIRWKDEFLTWNPQNYSGVLNMNVVSSDIWIPDVVLYNSADEKGSGRLYEAMKTQISVQNDGSVTWFCPMILKSECDVALSDFPFDSQTCPLVFGLWTFDNLKVNLTLARTSGDTASYLKNGVFILKGMPAKQVELYYPCCPGIPYTRISYNILLQRKTVFYLFNFLFPGSLLTVLSFLSFLLPPESGERMSLGITNLLALIVYMLMVSERIPPISESVPIITEFLLTVVAVNAITLFSSAFAIKFMFFEGDNSKSVPWAVRVLINKRLGNLLCMGCTEKCSSTGSHEEESFPMKQTTPRLKSMTWRTEETSNVRMRLSAPSSQSPSEGMETENYATRPEPRDGGKAMGAVCDGLNMVVDKLKEEESAADYQAEWRRAVQVIDRALCILLAVVTIAAGMFMFLKVPKFLVM